MKELVALREIELAPAETQATKAEQMIRSLEEQAAVHQLEAESLLVQETTGWRLDTDGWLWQWKLASETHRVRKQMKNRVRLARNAARAAKRLREIRDTLILSNRLIWHGQQYVPRPKDASVSAQT